jgi:hypothetical protein
MDDIYLNSDLKTKYMDDFENKVLKVTLEFWRICDNIREHLIRINKNPKIQTLYSKYPAGKHEMDHKESYLKFAYSQNIELVIFREFLPMLVGKYNQKNSSIFNYMFHEPYTNPNCDGEKSEIDIACINDKAYYMINHIRITLHSGNKRVHDEFWEFIANELSEIK